ncbi:hypothetical protein [Mucilaginibacter sp.]|uniref:hypothetical protein n=1 Tax=Mucilaginibacter sp. TaxID=1882438 RepID=UPI002629E208|nr:hypothetical protein [Mucilaginibacter sp.]
MNLKTKRDANFMSGDEILLNLQGKWKCIDTPYFLLHVKGDNISVNNESPQKIILEKFGSGWSFYLDVFIPDIENPILSLKIERISMEAFDNLFFGTKKFTFSTIYPTNAKTFKDMDIHDNALFRFELI